MKKILIIEDDAQIAKIERDYLTVNEFEIDIATSGDKGIKMAQDAKYDLILLDIMLPGTDGFTVCKLLRQNLDIPILMVTAKQEDFDTIKALSCGADDYIIKPFSLAVLVARVKSHLAQYERLKKGDGKKVSIITAGEITVNTDSRRVYLNEKEIELANKEYELLVFLMTNIDKVFDKDTLYERIWGYDALGYNVTVPVHIKRLREKIENDPANPKYIQTVWGAGYRFHAIMKV